MNACITATVFGMFRLHLCMDFVLEQYSAVTPVLYGPTALFS